MSKTSIFLLCILTLILGVFAYIKVTKLYITTPTLIAKVPTPSNTTRSKSTLSMIPMTLNAQPGKTNSIVIHLDMQGDVPTLLQFEIGYDPLVITPLELYPGDFFTTPKIVLNTMDPGSGRISYALQCTDAKTCVNQSTSTVATLTFSVNPYAIKKETALTFFPKTLLQTANGTQVLLKTQNAKILILGNVPRPATSSAVIAP